MAGRPPLEMNVPLIRLPSCVALLAAFVLAGCTAAPQINLDPTRVAEIRSIGVLTPAFPEKADAEFWLRSAMPPPGLLGAALVAGMRADRDANLNAVIGQQGFSMQDSFSKSLRASLQAQGFTVVMVPVARKAGEFLSRYPTSGANVDAYLDVVATDWGLVAGGFGSSASDLYSPRLDVQARLVSAKNGSVLMQRTVADNPFELAQKDIVHVASARELAPVPRGEIKDHPVNVVNDLRASGEATADTVAKLLR